MASVSTWQQALDLHIDYASMASARRSQLDESFGREFYGRMRGSTGTDVDLSPRQLGLVGAEMRKKFRSDDLLGCPTYFLTSDMGQIVLAFSQDAPPYPLDLTDAFAPSGFVVLADEWVLPSSEVSIRAMGWTTSGGTLGIHLFCQPMVSLVPLMPAEWAEGAEYSQMRDPDTGEVCEVPNEGAMDDLFLVRRFLSTLFALMRQELPAVESPIAPRALGKRASRQFGPDHKTKVITLRKRKRPWRPEDEEGGTDRVYTHRWLVSGFWRNQYYPSLGGPCHLPDGSQNPANHRPKRIGDYIKGPEHLPLIIKDTVYKVSR